MQKLCKCGLIMTIRLRTVIYQNKVDIENVPIFSCEACGRSEVVANVKPELTSLIAKLGSKPEKQQYFFHELSEIANLLLKVTEREHMNDSVEKIVEERINELLDVLLLAQSLGDTPWMDDIRKRLSQISHNALSA
jgi:methionyl-tRNA synthetase